MPNISDAQALAGLGLTPLWLVPPIPGNKDSGKSPVDKGWRLRPWTPPEKLRGPIREDCNLGILTGFIEGARRRVIVVDGDSEEALAWMAANLTPTPIKTVTSKGEHWFYADPRKDGALPRIGNKIRIRALGKELEIDVRGDGGLVVVAPSIHFTGHEYRAVEPWSEILLDAMPPFKPSWFKQLDEPTDDDEVKGQAPLTAGARHRALLSLAGSMRKKGMDADTIEAALLVVNQKRCQPPKHPNEVKKIAQDMGKKPAENKATDDGWDHALIMSDKGKPMGVTANVTTVLQSDGRWRGRLAYDAFRHTIVICDQPPWADADHQGGWDTSWADADDVRLKNWLAREYGMHVSTVAAREGAELVAKAHSFHPLQDFVLELRWDGVPRVDTWLSDYLGVPKSEYTRNVGRWWLISAVARALRPGCKADHLLILEGAQGIGKSSAARILASPEWFMDTPLDLTSKDAYQVLAGRWIIELAELDSLSRAEASRAKAFFSSPSDVFRPSYGHLPVERLRSCVFIGTVNHAEYLRDETGGRRYWPVSCGLEGPLNLPGLAEVRDQLWAEAAALYQAGERWWPAQGTETAICTAEQAARTERDPWESAIRTWLSTHAATRAHIVTYDVLKGIGLDLRSIDRAAQMRCGKVLIQLGFSHTRVRLKNGERIWAFVKDPVPALADW